MPRRNRAQRPEIRPLPGLGTREEPGPSWAQGEIFCVRTISASAARKRYLCPGCQQMIEPQTPHVVAWPKEIWAREDDRRHWHKGCWARR